MLKERFLGRILKTVKNYYYGRRLQCKSRKISWLVTGKFGEDVRDKTDLGLIGYTIYSTLESKDLLFHYE